MSDTSRFLRYLRFWGPSVRADVDDELAFHIEERVRDLEALGWTPAAARVEARRTFGDVAGIRDECVTIDQRRLRRRGRREGVSDMLQDLRQSARALRQSPGFTAIAVACVALGVCVTTTIFSAVNGILVRPLPYPEADRLAVVYARLSAKDDHGVNISYPDFLSWRSESRAFSALGIWTWTTPTFSGDGEAERVEGAAVSANLFPLLGVRPIIGRGFTPSEETPGKDREILLSHALWQRRYGGDPRVVGRTVTVYGLPYTVVGVMPRGFAFPDRGQAWVPFAPEQWMLARSNRGIAAAIGRLRPGVTMARAQADLDLISKRLQAEYPKDNFGWDAEVIPLRDDLVGDLRRPLLVFLGAVGLVLAIACANVANLMLARGASRRRETAMRAALGASRGRIVRQVLTESMLLALAGGLLGALLSRAGVQLLRRAFPEDVPFYFTLDVDRSVLAFALVVTAVTGIVFGLLPALRATAVDIAPALREGGRGEIGGRRSSRLRSALVVAEVALSVVLLVGATLLLRSYQSLTGTDLGFDEHGVLAARVSLPDAKYDSDEKRRAFYDRLYARLAAIPGVERVGSAQGIPFSGWNVKSSFSIEGRPARAQGEELDAHYQNVGPGYFATIGVPIVRGRGLTDADRDSSVLVGVINEVLARTEFAGQDPVGKRMRMGGADSKEPWITIVGVAKDFRHYDLPEPMGPAIYLPQLAAPSWSQTLVLRTRLADPTVLAPALKRAIAELDPTVPPYQVQTLEDVVSRSLWRQRLQGQVLGTFAALALLLAAVGIYGVVSYAVAQRTQEIGVRMALGASRRKVLALVLGEGARLALVGVAVGVVAALALSRVVESLLYGVKATDLATFAAVPVALALVALGASYVPARRATRVDPVVAMRVE